MNEDKKLQHPNVYNTKLPGLKEMEKDRVRNLEEIRVNLSAAILKNDTGQCVIWTINLHKYIILYGLAFTRYGQSVSAPHRCCKLNILHFIGKNTFFTSSFCSDY